MAEVARARISSIGNAAGSRSSASSRSPARVIWRRDVVAVPQLGGRSGVNSLPITSREVASGSTRENTVLKKWASSPTDVSSAYVPCSSVTKLAIEPSPRRAHHHAEVGEAPHEQRVPGAEDVDGRLGQLGERDHERGCVLAPVGRARAAGSTKCSTTATSGPGGRHLRVALVEHRGTEPGGEPAHPLTLRLAAPRDASREFVSGNPGRDVQRVGTARFLGEDVAKVHDPVWGVIGTLGDSQCYLGVRSKVDAVHAALAKRIHDDDLPVRLIAPAFTLGVSDGQLNGTDRMRYSLIEPRAGQRQHRRAPQGQRHGGRHRRRRVRQAAGRHARRAPRAQRPR